jgi:hypothetical protein
MKELNASFFDLFHNGERDSYRLQCERAGWGRGGSGRWVQSSEIRTPDFGIFRGNPDIANPLFQPGLIVFWQLVGKDLAPIVHETHVEVGPVALTLQIGVNTRKRAVHPSSPRRVWAVFPSFSRTDDR